MASVILDFYDEDAPNTLLGSLEDDDLETLEHRPTLFDLGALVFRVPKATAAANANLLRKTNLVRVRYPTPFGTTRKWVGVLKDYRTVLVSAKEQGGEFVEWTAVGALFMLSYAALRTQPFAPAQPALGSLTEVPARDWVWLNEPAGAILTRIIEEGQNQPGEPLADWSIDFDRTEDSAGNLWTAVIGEFRVPIGTSVLDVAARLATAGDLFLVLDPDLTLHAYQSYDDFTTDRTGAFGAGNVRFEHGVNILTELSRESDAIPATHITQRASDGDLHTEVDAAYGGGRGHYIYNEADTNDGDMLERIAQRAIDASKADAEQIAFEVIPGDDEAAGAYFPQDHYDLGDLVSVKSGNDDVDLEDAALRVVGWRIVLDRASRSATAAQAYRSLHVVPELAYRPLRHYTTARSIGGSVGATPGCSCLRLCQAVTVTPGTAERLYFTTSAGTDRPFAAWGNTDDMDTVQLSLTPTSTGSANMDWAHVNQAATSFGLVAGVITLSNAGLLAMVQGVTSFRVQSLIGIRHGIGIDESAHREYLEGTIRVYRPGTGYIGTILALGAATSATPANTDPAGTLGNRALAGLATAVPSAVATDVLVVELGLVHTAPTSGGAGGAVAWGDYGGTTDLPEDESTTGAGRAWIELRTAAAATGSGRVIELSGTDSCAAHGDHAHTIVSDRAPGVTDDLEGYPAGTYWIVVDDVDNPTTVLGTYYSFDDSDDAAVWILQADPSPTPTIPTPTIVVEEVDGAPSVDVERIIFPNGSVTDNGDDSATIALAAAVHSHDAPTPGFHGVLVQRTTNFTSTFSNDSIPDFDTQIYDTEGLWEGVTNPDRLTIPAAWDGLMAVFEAWAGWAGNSADYVEMKLYRNGTADEGNLISVTQHRPNIASPFQELHTPPVQVFEGDYFTITLKTPTSQTAITYNNASILFGAYLVGTPGEQGEPGEGVPTGGTAGQVLTKDSGTDFDTSWQTPSASGSSGRPLMAYDPGDSHWYVVVDGDGTAVMVPD